MRAHSGVLSRLPGAPRPGGAGVAQVAARVARREPDHRAARRTVLERLVRLQVQRPYRHSTAGARCRHHATSLKIGHRRPF